MICALLLFFWSWRLYLAFTRHGRTDAAFLSALLIGFSFYASFYAPAFAIAFALSTPPLHAPARDPTCDRHPAGHALPLRFIHRRMDVSGMAVHRRAAGIPL
jgi:hypothetical protein